ETLQARDMLPTMAQAGWCLLFAICLGGITASHGFEYKGCYKDSRNRDLPKLAQSSSSMSVERCGRLCSSYRYFGVQFSKECWCGNSYGKHGKRPGRECNMACRGNSREKCGSHWRNNVYATRSTGSRCKRVRSTPSSLSSYKSKVGQCFEFRVTGRLRGNVWGSGIYTADSSLSKAAVHAGIVRNGQTKYIRVRVLRGRSSYRSTRRNGVKTRRYGRYRLSYKFIGSRSVPSKKPRSCPSGSRLSVTSRRTCRCARYLLDGSWAR
ncbi:hypothetical protein BOX15_Mlig023956g1, partial [Macrostomum lignano]